MRQEWPPWTILNRRVTDENAYPPRTAVDRPFVGRGGRRPCPVGRSARQGRVPELVQSSGAGEIPARRGDAALVLLLRGAEGLRGSGRRGQFLRDRRLGVRLDPHAEPDPGNRRLAE